MKNWSAKRIAFDAVLIALCMALTTFSIDFGIFKLTFENLPIIIGAVMFGPLDGFLIGALGGFLGQLLSYGLDATTVFWIIPYALSGLFVGLLRNWTLKYYIEEKDLKKTTPRLIAVLVINCIFVTLLNTAALYIVYKYIWFTAVEALFAALPWKLVVSVIRGILFAIVTPLILAGLHRAKLFSIKK